MVYTPFAFSLGLIESFSELAIIVEILMWRDVTSNESESNLLLLVLLVKINETSLNVNDITIKKASVTQYTNSRIETIALL